MRKRNYSFPIAGFTLAMCWLLFLFYFNEPFSHVLFILGNVVIFNGVLLILLSMITLRKKGELDRGKDFTATTTIVKDGVFSLVRHPLYLGWLLLYPAAMLVSQHWLICIIGVIGIASMVQITETADFQLTIKFGSEYEAYTRDVPRLNIISGIFRKFFIKDKE